MEVLYVNVLKSLTSNRDDSGSHRRNWLGFHLDYSGPGGGQADSNLPLAEL